MPREYSSTEKRNLEAVSRLFAPPPGFDVTTLFADDAVWWNGLPRLRGEGSCEHRGIEAIRAIVTGASRDASRLGVDAYDLATVRNEDVLVLADGDHVVRQHTMYAKTRAGRDYSNVYCFVFRFREDGRIAYLTEHWNTWWADRFLFDQRPPEPAHPLPPERR
ncbi:MAG TPA: nuclear transport factor 2 family protein [Myxococcota bacterium]|nr:nuclear transport factor 2 family protein [Myxococcota bacterium]